MSKAYDNGYRCGMFHKCNGIDEIVLDECEFNEYNIEYAAGYMDGYESNERKI